MGYEKLLFHKQYYNNVENPMPSFFLKNFMLLEFKYTHEAFPQVRIKCAGTKYRQSLAKLDMRMYLSRQICSGRKKE